MPSSNEPSVNAPAVRRFKDPNHVEVACTLGGLRDIIDELDEQIVNLLAKRALCVIDATRFKRDAFQVSAPARQEQVFQRVRRLAALHESTFAGFPDLVESTYRTLVAGLISSEVRFFEETEQIDR
jgi:isochorismate pyruvate lyase